MASEFLTTHAESSFTMRPRSSRRAARRLASAARRFLVPASLGLLAILGLNDTAYTFQVRAMNGDAASPPSNEASATPRLGICDRTKQVRDAIVAKIAGVGNCTQVTDAHMAKIKGRLRLENTQISSLRSGDFAGLPNLRVIHLHGNRLSSLPPDVFDGLSSLEELELYANQLTTLPSDVFNGLSSLIWLDLGANQLTTLPSDVFDGLSSLEWLILWENQLNSLPSDVFGGLSSLTKLNLRANRLSILPSDVFDGLSSLEWLFLRENQLSSLPSNVFDGLSSLRELNLRTNRLSILPSDVFDGLSSLEGLLLDRNQLTLTGLPSDVFEGLSSLEMLNLQHNRLSSLPDGVFEGLSSLEWLLLYENPVDPMPLTVSLEKVGDSGFKATVLAGAPFTMTFPVSVTNGNIVGGATTLTIPAGAVESGILSVTRAVGTTDAVTVDIGAPLPRLEGYHQGYALAKATDLPRVILADDETPLTARFEGMPEAHNDGIPQVGNTLEVSFAEPTSGALAYQWLRGSEVIAGATASTHVLTVADVGARLSVRVESGGDSVTSTATAPVWPAPANPPLADGEEELLSATVTLGSHQFPFWVAGYGRVQGESFGEMDVVSFKDGGATYAVDAFLVNSRGVFALATGSTLPDASGLVAYWNGYRISGLEADTANGGRLPMLVGRTPQPSTEYSRYEDRASDGVQVAVSLRRVSAEAQNALTASFEAMPEAHDGESAFRFRVAFSEKIAISYRSLREDAFAVAGGRVTRGKRVDRRKDLFEITVDPDGGGEVAISLPAGRECEVSGAICTWGPPRKQLTNTPAATVAGPPVEPLTASFEGVPAEHDGETAFKLRIAFSEPLSWMNSRRLREHVVAVAGGRATKAGRVNRRRDLWKLTVEPDSLADVTVTLAAGAACRTPAAVCTSDGRALSTTIATTVRGPVAVSVADARAEEGTDATLDFAVTLSRAASGTVAVAYATADGTATAGADYTARKGQLTFDPGETATTVRVPVLDDAHDEGEETLTLRLSAASGAVLADGTATGTIVNSDKLQQAWLARFGRTVATHVTDAVGDRLRGTPGQESHLTVGGYRLPVGQRGATDGAEDGVSGVERLVLALGQRLGLGRGTAPSGSAGTGTGPWAASQADPDPRLVQSRTLDLGSAVNLRQVLLGSSFRLALGGDAVGASRLRLTAWGRVAGTTFDGRDGDLSLDGDVLTGTVGVDGEWDRLLAGLAVAHSRGDGSFSMTGLEANANGQGELETTLTSVHPYLRYAVNDRLAVWGLLGFGTGQMELEVANGEIRETDTDLLMGAFGGRGILLAALESGGFQLATRTDAMLTRTTSDAVQTADGNMASGEADAHRLRLVLEGSRGVTWAEGRRLTPTMELGLRHDWGDAETGFGLELGGRVQYADPALGLTIDATVRGLLAHEDSDYEEWGASGSLRLDSGSAGQGLALTLAPTWGAASSGVDGLWSRQTTGGLAQNTQHRPAGRLNAEVGYGLAAPFGTGLLTPYAGAVLSDGEDRTYRVGGRLHLTGRAATGLALNLEGTRQEPAGQQPVNQGLRVQTTWSF